MLLAQRIEVEKVNLKKLKITLRNSDPQQEESVDNLMSMENSAHQKGHLCDISCRYLEI
jgi:hypothetical protein